jgi:hypothetical protein
MSKDLSWVRHKWGDWHLEDVFSARAKYAGHARTACNQEISESYANFERAPASKVPHHQRCSECQGVALQHGTG